MARASRYSLKAKLSTKAANQFRLMFLSWLYRQRKTKWLTDYENNFPKKTRIGKGTPHCSLRLEKKWMKDTEKLPVVVIFLVGKMADTHPNRSTIEKGNVRY